MIYVVAFGLLVAVAAWLVAVYNKLNFLREQVQEAWLQWSRVTVQRNACLGDFANEFAACMPRFAAQAADLRRLAEDSRFAVLARPCAPRPGGLRGVREMEHGLRLRVKEAVHMVESATDACRSVDLSHRWQTVADVLMQQEKMARCYDRSAGDYNNALVGPVSGLVAGVFGFLPVAQMIHKQ